jgi:hypothetical protein
MGQAGGPGYRRDNYRPCIAPLLALAEYRKADMRSRMPTRELPVLTMDKKSETGKGTGHFWKKPTP